MRTYKIFVLLLMLATFSFAATNVSTCQVINSGGEYVLNTSLEGAPVEATPSGTACIRINTSNVLLDCAGFTITENGTLGTKTGVNVGPGLTNITVQNCPNVSNYDHGFYVASSLDVTLRNNTAYNNTQHGFIIVSNANSNVLQDNNAIENGFHGFRLQDASEAVVSGNTATDNTQYGFYLLAESNSSNYTNNVVSGSNTGFYIEDSGYNRFVGNNVSGTSSRAIYAGGTSAYNQFLNNTLSGGTLHGVRLNSDGGFNTLTGNTVYGYSQYGIYLVSSANNTISSNNASNNNRAGIYLSGSDNNTVTGNEASYNDYYGIHLSNSHNNTLNTNNADGNGDMPTTFHLSQLDSSDVWQEMYSSPFATMYSTKEFKFNKVNGQVKLRVVQNGNAPFADVEAIQLTACGVDITPTYAKYVDSGESVLEDILAIDHNVAIAHEKEIEVSWGIPTSCNEQAIVALTANEYFSGLPLYFPDAGYAAISQNIAVPLIDGYLDETDGIEEPTYTDLWRSDSGHPTGYTYIYTSQDDENVYLSLDITSDNTNEYGLDWLEITFLTDEGDKTFRVDDYSDQYGKCGFGLTSKVTYKHQTCEVKIPKSEIKDNDLEFLLHYYGTEALTQAAILLESSNDNTLTSNNMTNTVNGYGAYLSQAHRNTLTSNREHGNDMYGTLVANSNGTSISADHMYNNNNADFFAQFTGTGYILNLSQVIFDNPLGNLVNYTTISLNDNNNVTGMHSIKWNALPSSPPKNSVAQKSINITTEGGSVFLDSITWHWTDSEVTGFNEGSFAIYMYNSTWNAMNATLSTAANTLTIANLVPASVYAILADNATINPGSGTGDDKKNLAFEYGTICPGDIIEVNVTSGIDPLENAEVRLIYLPTIDVVDKITNSTGQVTFPANVAGEYKLRVTKSKYHPEETTFTYSTCPTEEPPEPPPEEPPPVEPPETPLINLTIPPSLNVTDQEITDSMIEIYKAFFDEPGCIVLHLVNPDGSPGAVVGMSEVFSGNKSDMQLILDNYNNETELMAMLHYDDGDGICEPEEDKPATVDGKPVAVKFKLSLPPAAPPTPPTEPEPTPPEAPSKPAPEEPADDMSGFLMLLILLLLLGGAGALYYFLGKKK
jgi:parallel beta-helix repeat protein